MHPPFTAEEFFEVFRRYNEAVWPAQIALLAAGLAAAWAAFRAHLHSSWPWARAAILLLAALWLWSGVAYHYLFFSTLTRAGLVFANLFFAEVVLLLLCAWQNGSMVESPSRTDLAVATVLIAYAMMIYPAVGLAAGHEYPAAPTFGAPCPTVIFTFGIFCLLPRSVPRFAVAIPVVWAVIGTSGALNFGVPEDFGLPAAAAAAIFVLYRATHPPLWHRWAW